MAWSSINLGPLYVILICVKIQEIMHSYKKWDPNWSTIMHSEFELIQVVFCTLIDLTILAKKSREEPI